MTNETKLKFLKAKPVEVHDWDTFVEQVYGKPYKFQQQDGCKDRGTYSLLVPCEEAETFQYENTEIPFEVNGEIMGVTFEVWMNTSPKETEKHFILTYQNEMFWERNFYPSIEMIANDLHSKGLLESGEYLIIIDW